jgi:hypothetical protein
MENQENLKAEGAVPEPEAQAAPEKKPLPEIPKTPQPLEAEVQLPGQPKQKVTVEPLAANEGGSEAIIKVSAPKPPEKAEGDATGLALLALMAVGAFVLLASSKQQPPPPSM